MQRFACQFIYIAEIQSILLTNVEAYDKIKINKYDDEDGRRYAFTESRRLVRGGNVFCLSYPFGVESPKPVEKPGVDAFRRAALRQRACWSP